MAVGDCRSDAAGSVFATGVSGLKVHNTARFEERMKLHKYRHFLSSSSTVPTGSISSLVYTDDDVHRLAMGFVGILRGLEGGGT